MYVHGLGVVGGTAGLPYGARTHAPAWANGEAVTTSYQRWHDGITYRATTTGTTSGTSPLDDSAVSWATVDDTYAIYNEKYLSDVSEPTWAIMLALNGETEEDFGGDIHGNVTLANTEIRVNNLPISLTDYLPLYAEDIMVVQTSEAAHTATPATVVADIVMRYGVMAGGHFPYNNKIIPKFTGQMGWYYPAMLPLYHYHVGQDFRYQLRRCLVQGMGAVKPSDYYGQTNPKFGENRSLEMLGLVDIKSPAGASGVPASDKDGEFKVAVSLQVTRGTMLDFAEAGATTYWDMNTSGADVSAGGYSGMLCKGYFRASDGSVKRDLAVDDVIEVDAIYRVTMHRGTAGEP
jgi:hypothetical protein